MNSLYSPGAFWFIFREIEVILLIKYPIEIAPAIKQASFSLLILTLYVFIREKASECTIEEKKAKCSGKIINCTRENAFSHYSFPTLLLSYRLQCRRPTMYFFFPLHIPFCPFKAVKWAGRVLNWALICCAHVYPSLCFFFSFFELIS